jgi:hypothetical protein
MGPAVPCCWSECTDRPDDVSPQQHGCSDRVCVALVHAIAGPFLPQCSLAIGGSRFHWAGLSILSRSLVFWPNAG